MSVARRKIILRFIYIAAALLAVGYICLRTFLYDMYTQPSESMLPTFEVGDIVVVSKQGYGNYRFFSIPIYQSQPSRLPNRGEIFVFYPPHDERLFIKRIIGLPGDVIELNEKKLFINSELVSSVPDATAEFIQETLDGINYTVQYNSFPSKFSKYKGKVPDKHYFVMGDNRNNSADSRMWGFVEQDHLVGRVIYP